MHKVSFMRSRSWVAPIYLLAFVAAVISLAVALFAQHGLGMMPCAWCVFQRLLLLCSAALAVGSYFCHSRQLPRAAIVGGVLFIISTLGGVAAAWHQYTVAAQSFSCSQTLADKTIQLLGLDALWPAVFGIYASCMQAQTQFLGLDFALWSLFLFVGLTALGVLALGLFGRSLCKKKQQLISAYRR